MTDNEKNSMEQCPECGSEDNTVGFAADFDVRCNDCYALWDVRNGKVISV